MWKFRKLTLTAVLSQKISWNQMMNHEIDFTKNDFKWEYFFRFSTLCGFKRKIFLYQNWWPWKKATPSSSTQTGLTLTRKRDKPWYTVWKFRNFTLTIFCKNRILGLAYKSYLNSGNLISRNIFQVRVKFWFFHTVWAVWQYHLQFAINCFFFVERWITFCRIWSHSDFSILTCYTYRHLQCSKYKQYFFKKWYLSPWNWIFTFWNMPYFTWNQFLRI